MRFAHLSQNQRNKRRCSRRIRTEEQQKGDETPFKKQNEPSLHCCIAKDGFCGSGSEEEKQQPENAEEEENKSN